MALSTGQIHGLIMMFSFGWLLPLGVLSARLLKHRPNDAWFQIHRTVQLVAVLIGIIGFSIAAKNFNVFQDEEGSTSYRHGILGVMVFTLVLLQPLMALMRPAKSNDFDGADGAVAAPGSGGDNYKHWCWSVFHKLMGYSILVLVFVTILLGAKMEGTAWQLSYVFGVVGSLLLIAAYMWYDRFSYQPPMSSGTGTASTEMGSYP